MGSKGSIIIAQFSRYKITISQNKRSFSMSNILKNVKFLSSSRGLHRPDLPSPCGRKFQFLSIFVYKVCTISFERPVNYLCDAWHVFPPKYEAWTHFNRTWTEYQCQGVVADHILWIGQSISMSVSWSHNHKIEKRKSIVFFRQYKGYRFS